VVHAIILIPRSKVIKKLKLTANYFWPSREPRYNFRGFLWHALKLPLYGFGLPFTNFPPAGLKDEVSSAESFDIILPQQPRMTVKRISYSPMLLKETPGTL